MISVVVLNHCSASQVQVHVQATLELSMLHCEAAECDLAIRHLAQALRADPLIGENYHQDLMACLANVESKYAAYRTLPPLYQVSAHRPR